jgi:hypothetical protein
MSDRPENVQSLILEQLRLIRRDIADLRTITLHTADHSRRIERRIEEVRDDLEMMLKNELMGRLGTFEMRVDEKLDAAVERLEGKGGPSGPAPRHG